MQITNFHYTITKQTLTSNREIITDEELFADVEIEPNVTIRVPVSRVFLNAIKEDAKTKALEIVKELKVKALPSNL